MKKITLFFALFLSLTVLLNAQTLTINTINGDDPNTFATNSVSSPLAGETALAISITYAGIADRNGGADPNMQVKMFDNWAQLNNVEYTFAASASEVTTTVNTTIPSINPGTDKGRLQVRFWNGTNWTIATYTNPLMTIADAAVDTNVAVAITSINSMTPTDFYNSVSGALTEGAVLTVGVDYTAIKPDPNNGDAVQVRVNFLNDWSQIPEMVQGTAVVTSNDNPQSTTVSVTVPNIGTTITDLVRIQAIGYGFNAGTDEDVVANLGAPLYSIDHTTLSSVVINKNKLSAFYNASTKVVSIDANSILGDYKIFNIMGQSILEGEVSKEINVESLKSGIYILSTDSGYLKFAK